MVLENITRRREAGEPAFAAAIAGAREVGFTVVSMSLSLIAVFIPILLMGGIVGRLFREFAVVLSAAILISLLVSLTTTPMMCARCARARPAQRPAGRRAAASERGDTWRCGGYEAAALARLGAALPTRWTLLMRAAGTATIALNVYLYTHRAEGLLSAAGHRAQLIGSIQADQSISFQAMRRKLAAFIEIVRNDPAVATVTGFTGGGARNSGRCSSRSSRWPSAKESADQVIARLRAASSRRCRAPTCSCSRCRTSASAAAQSQRAVPVHAAGRRHRRAAQLGAAHPRALSRLPQLADVNTDQQDKGLQTSLVIDRDAAARLGISMPRRSTPRCNDAFGQRQVSTIYNPLNQYHVVLEVAPQFRDSPEDLRDFSVRNANGVAVPLSQFARWASPTPTPLSVNHQGQFAASTISFNLPEGVSLSEATAAIDRRPWRASACRRACSAVSKAPPESSSARSPTSRCSSWPRWSPSTWCSASSTRAWCTR